MKWKICGMREEMNCAEVAHLAPDFMGFIFVKNSPRYVGDDFVIPHTLPSTIQKVGVFVDELDEKIIELASRAGFTWVQLHGEERGESIARLKGAGLKVIKAISVAAEADVAQANLYTVLPDYFLFDTKKGAQVGGTGELFDWDILKAYSLDVPIILAGGLSLGNLEKALQLSEVYPIDVLDFNSRMELRPGLKNVEQLTRLAEQLNDLKKTEK